MEKESIDIIYEIIELTKKGLSRPEIAKECGVSESTVYKYQKKFELI